MEFTGISKHIDSLGRIVIPKRIRNQLSNTVQVHINNNCIILNKINSNNNKKLRFTERFDSCGRLYLPVEIRKYFNLECDDRLQIYTDSKNQIILKKENISCIFCNNSSNSSENMTVFHKKMICKCCLSEILKIVENKKN